MISQLTMPFERNLELGCFIENLVEIVIVYLGPEQRVSVHFEGG